MAQKITSRPQKNGGAPKKKRGRPRKKPEETTPEVVEAHDAPAGAGEDAPDDAEENTGPLSDIPSDAEIQKSQSRAKHRDFNGWMEEHKQYPENYPDHFFFRIMRTHPKHNREGAPIAGPVEYYNRAFYLEDLRKQLPEGGRFDVELVGPIRTAKGEIRRNVIRAAFRSLELPDLRERLTSNDGIVTPQLLDSLGLGGPDQETDESEDDDDVGDGSNGRSENAPFMDKLMDTHFQDLERMRRKNEQYERELRERMEREYRMRDRDRERSSKPQDEVTSTLLSSLMDLTKSSLSKKDNEGVGQHDREELSRLHDQISKAQEEHRRSQEAHQREMTERLQAQAREWQDRMEELRKSYEKLMGDLRERYDSEINRLREGHTDKVEGIQAQYREAREDLTAARSTIESLRTELAQAHAESNRVQSELAALKTTKDADIRAAVIEAERRVEQAAKPKKTDDEDPLEGMVKRVKKARELSETLGETLGGGSSKAGAETGEKKGFGKNLVEVVRSLAGSEDVRKLTTDVTKSVTSAMTSAAREYGSRSGSQVPSTTAAAAAYQAASSQPPAPMQPQTPMQPQHPAPVQPQTVQPPSQGSPPVVPDPVSVADSTATEVQPDVIDQTASDMLDSIEDHATIGTQIDEAAKDVLGQLSRSLGVTESVIRDNIKGATAEKTLEELGLPATRLTPEATAYLNQIISSVSQDG